MHKLVLSGASKCCGRSAAVIDAVKFVCNVVPMFFVAGLFAWSYNIYILQVCIRLLSNGYMEVRRVVFDEDD